MSFTSMLFDDMGVHVMTQWDWNFGNLFRVYVAMDSSELRHGGEEGSICVPAKGKVLACGNHESKMLITCG